MWCITTARVTRGICTAQRGCSYINIHTHKRSLFECSTSVSMCLPYVKGGHLPAPLPQCM